MKTPLVSIIVPIYKVEKYLKRCIDSLLCQSYSNLEIILVDDGSPDQCPQICDSYAKNDTRIVVIHKKNGGISDARNAGIEKASGEYLAFVDSDDYVSPYYVEKLLDALIENQCDVAICDFKKVHDAAIVKEEIREGVHQKIYNNKKDLLNIFYTRDCGKIIVAWNKMFKKELFINVRYPVGRIYEDEATIYKLLYFAKKVVFIDAPLYYYYVRADSITTRAMSLDNLQAFISLKEVVQFYERHHESYLKKKAVDRLLRSAILYSLSCHYNGNSENEEIIQSRLKEIFFENIREYSFYYMLPKYGLYYCLKRILMAKKKHSLV